MGIAPLCRAKNIAWHVESKKDPRWNKSGHSTVAMMFQYADEAMSWVKKCEKRYGKRPKDLTYEANME